MSGLSLLMASNPCLTWNPSTVRKLPVSISSEPLTQRSRRGLTMLSMRSTGTYQENELTRNLSEDTRPQSSQLAEQLWTNPGLKSGISVRELICT